MLVHGNDDDSTDSIGKDKEKLSSILSIFQSIKRSGDNVDHKKSENLYILCDFGLSIIKRLTPNEDNILDLSASVCLPPTLYKSHEKTEGADTPVGESPSWLVDESVLAYFQSLKFDANELVTHDVIDDDLMVNETDGSEMPLSKIMERLKAKGTKARREVKNEAKQGGEKKENDLDVLKMVQEINSDNLGSYGKYESSNGHDDLPVDTELEHKLQKRKKMLDEPSNLSVPKRQRSLSAPSYKSPPSKGTAKKGSTSSGPNESDGKFGSGLDERPLRGRSNEPAESDLLVSSIRNTSRFHAKHEEKKSASENDKKHVARKLDKEDHRKPKNSRVVYSSPATYNSDSTANKKPRRKNIAGLAKCSTNQSPSIDLIGSRIKIWWPMDKMFYEGIVKSFDTQKKKHVVLYEDGDVEVLRLDKERWEIVGEGRKPQKPSKLLKGSRPKKELKRNSCSVSPPNKLIIDLPSSSQARGKRTPRKNLKHGLKEILKQGVSLDGRTEDESVFEPAEPLDHDLDSEEEQTSATELAEKDEESVSEGKRDGIENFSSKSEEFQEEERDSEGELAEVVTGSSFGARGSKGEVSPSDEDMQQDASEEAGEEATENEGSQGKGTDEMEMEHEEPDLTSAVSPIGSAEFSDDEPLSMWKQRVGK